MTMRDPFEGPPPTPCDPHGHRDLNPGWSCSTPGCPCGSVPPAHEPTLTQRIWTALEGRDDKRWRVLIDQWHESVKRWGPESGPAKGALLELVREAWGSPGMSAGQGMDRDGAIVWGVTGHNGSGLAVATGDTELAALVGALEAAPE